MHWEAFVGEKATINCQQTQRVTISEPYALEIIVEVPASDWASCEYYFDKPRDFTSSEALTFQLYSDTQDFPFTIMLYSGDPGSPELFGFDMVTNQSQFLEWQPVSIPWTSFNPIWTENVSIDLTRVEGIVFAFGTETDTTGTIAIEDLTIGSLTPNNQELSDPEILSQNGEDTTSESDEDNPVLAIREQLCGGIFLIPLLPCIIYLLKRKYS